MKIDINVEAEDGDGIDLDNYMTAFDSLNGLQLIAAEAARQFNRGYDLVHDQAHEDEDGPGLFDAAAATLLNWLDHEGHDVVVPTWVTAQARKPYVERLAIAGAWIARQIDLELADQAGAKESIPPIGPSADAASEGS